jgi:hypothetical protein
MATFAGGGARRRRLVAFAASVAALSALLSARQSSSPARATPPAVASSRASLPVRLTDQQFWTLSESMSEPDGYFRSENLVSNEHTFQYVIPALVQQVRPGGVYLGVAPDQNFTYIAALRAPMAFIVDIRRGNLLQHLMYKAIFELSKDRADFISLLFSKKRPAHLGTSSTAIELFAAFDRVDTNRELYMANVAAIRNQLVRRHAFKLSVDDLEQIESIYFAFFLDGPGIRYSVGSGFGGRAGFGMGFPTFADLMVQTDWDGIARSYLATEANFRFIKGLQERNLIVPVVGNFAGPKALRAVGRYVRDLGARIGAFYVSNVEQYLFQDGLFEAFARNVATLPVDSSSTFIRSVAVRYGYGGRFLGPDGRASALDPIGEFLEDFSERRLMGYIDVNARSR